MWYPTSPDCHLSLTTRSSKSAPDYMALNNLDLHQVQGWCQSWPGYAGTTAFQRHTQQMGGPSTLPGCARAGILHRLCHHSTTMFIVQWQTTCKLTQSGSHKQYRNTGLPPAMALFGRNLREAVAHQREQVLSAVSTLAREK